MKRLSLSISNGSIQKARLLHLNCADIIHGKSVNVNFESKLKRV